MGATDPSSGSTQNESSPVHPNARNPSSSSSPSSSVMAAEETAAAAAAAAEAAALHAYNMRNVLNQARSMTPADAANSVDHIVSSACFRTSFLWSSGVSLLLALHRKRLGGSVLRVANDAALGFMGTFGVQWYLCRRDEHDKKLALRAFYQNQQKMRTQLRPLPSGVGGRSEVEAVRELSGGVGGEGRKNSSSSGSSSGSSSSSSSDEDWKTEIDRLTAYEFPEVKKGPERGMTLR